MDYKEAYDGLKRRFDHLMQSEFIAGFDAYDSYKKEYVRDIKLADEMGFRKSKNSIEVEIKAVGLDEIEKQLERVKSLLDDIDSELPGFLNKKFNIPDNRG